MADYTNYSIVSWSDTTPITSVRLNQMSVNIDQVKIVNDDKPKGILKLREINNNISNTAGGIYANTKIIALTQETIGNTSYDDRVTLESGRYYKLCLNLPGIQQTSAGGEDGSYYIRFREGNTAGSGNIICSFKLNSGIGAYIDVASVTPANKDQLKVKGNIAFGAGKYETVLYDVVANNQSYFVELQRVENGSNANASGWTVLASEGNLQFYIEDVGGTI